ncbi:GntR family transcriptional regulator [Pseudorhodoferax sp. Leaf274]|uniref:GntR family transcriptional regulator n=1 Tax=Pseudorhodoferax sp. Leaf274 TaxID=1736318 RepID=UPI0007026F6D|nr:GntR family transcriptional regulator [Pseudorhodoferax sp. Leaf274]KQP45632.1 transcriptional regulator [Pseudorhodoferax sp. Leaf274]
MANRSTARPKLVSVDEDAPARTGKSASNLAGQAYDRIEELLVSCTLAPGRFLAMHELQAMVGYGRTPVHQALSRLAADTLVQITPRHGFRIAPIDLTRERLLLRLRREMERFVIRLATERSGASERNRMQHIKRQLVEHGARMTVEQFNVVDRLIDQQFLAAAQEPFVEGTLRPLHTIFRRIGWIYHMHKPDDVQLQGTVDGHIAVIEAVASGQVEAAMAASDRLMDFVDSMFDVLERDVPPSRLDCSLDADDRMLELTKAIAGPR